MIENALVCFQNRCDGYHTKPWLRNNWNSPKTMQLQKSRVKAIARGKEGSYPIFLSRALQYCFDDQDGPLSDKLIWIRDLWEKMPSKEKLRFCPAVVANNAGECYVVPNLPFSSEDNVNSQWSLVT